MAPDPAAQLLALGFAPLADAPATPDPRARGIAQYFAAHPGPHTLTSGSWEAHLALDLARLGRLTLLERGAAGYRFQSGECHSPFLVNWELCP